MASSCRGLSAPPRCLASRHQALQDHARREIWISCPHAVAELPDKRRMRSLARPSHRRTNLVTGTATASIIRILAQYAVDADFDGRRMARTGPAEYLLLERISAGGIAQSSQ